MTNPTKEEIAGRPTLNKRFLVQLKGRDYATYTGLLDLAHQHGLTELKVDIVQLPCPDNGMECIVRATAVTESGAMFSDLGDANPHNTNKSVSQHIVRMASNRAKARVLRDMTNIGMTALEELGDEPGDMPGNGNGKAKPRKAAGNGKNAEPVTDAQKRAIWALGKSRGYDEHSLHDLAETTYGCGVASLTGKDAAALIQQLQAH